jgi:metal-responsive CopG/Arc/MetJ family transcriptional regulator
MKANARKESKDPGKMVVQVELSPELNKRLMEYVAKSRGVLYCQRSEVIVEAIKEYLDRHERKVRRANA